MVTAVIPSRFHSSRFPGKALIPVGGVPLVVRVAGAVLRAGVADRIRVATDDLRIAAAVHAALPEVEVRVIQRPLRTGTDRVAAAVEDLPPDAGPVLNVQGDEALVSGAILRAAIAALETNDIGTVAAPLEDPAQPDHPDTVKVTVADDGRATEFSRASLGPAALVHLGVYCFTPDALRRFAALPTGDRERREGLEQLRAMERGWRIGVATVATRVASVNRPDDVRRVESMLFEPKGTVRCGA